MILCKYSHEEVCLGRFAMQQRSNALLYLQSCLLSERKCSYGMREM